jgi:hypothetical protein
MSGTGVFGQVDTGNGVAGWTNDSSNSGVWGNNTSDGPGVGVAGSSVNGVGVLGTSTNSSAIQGTSQSSEHAGVAAINDSGGETAFGVWARGSPAGHFETTTDWDALFATTSSPKHAGVSANNTSPASGDVPTGFGLWASSNNTGIYSRGTPAGYFEGDVLVTGDLVLVNTSGDVAEDFDVEAEPLNGEPGTVLIINENGDLCASDAPYDTRVAGVVAGAGDLKPALVLQRVPSQKPRSPIALVGKAFCKIDATFGKVRAGDLLTTSATPGHAMKASDRSRAVGAIIGKALASLDAGIGLIPILVSPR